MTHPAFEQIPDDLPGPDLPDIIDLKPLDLLAAFTSTPPALDFVLPGLLAGTVGALVSPGATGKTMLALQACATLAGGPDTLELDGLGGWSLIRGKTMFMTAEDPPPVLAQRLHALGQGMNQAQQQTVAQHLKVLPMLGRNPSIMHQGWRDWMIDQAGDDTRLIVIDTLRRFHAGDENNSGEMAEVVAMLEQLSTRTGAGVLFLHHTSKAGALAGGGDQQASRGSSVLTDNARLQANLATISPDEAGELGISEDQRPFHVRFSFPKVNYSAPIETRYYQRKPGGLLMPFVQGGAYAHTQAVKNHNRGRRREI